ncbi:MAG: aspartyl/glutamyl-tRNA(Asn/Gln) amidotransferase subunit C [Rhodothalassiaceae bacterium]|nr:MAG: aspartyl/glutamyl-tRNA(Asn/Gln) amidotransferase subunit C [Rhodothalassiaceae bacterium]
MSIDRGTVTKIAQLARIRLDEDEAARLEGELKRILDWVAALQAVDTEGVEPLSSVVGTRLRWRADEVTDGNCREDILANAPERVDGFFAVPKVIE